MSARLLSPIFVGCGAGIVLFGAMTDLPVSAYMVNIPFWPLVVMPSGLLWKNKFLNRVNEGEFPTQMKSYRELFLVSRKAMLYELFLNQIGYHCMLGFAFLTYTYWMRALYDRDTTRKPFGQLTKEIAFGFVKMRAFFATLSLLTQFWGAKMNLMTSPEGKIYLSPNTIRMLLLKETLINIFWMASIAKLVHEHYPATVAKQIP